MLQSLAAIDSAIEELNALPSALPRSVRAKTTSSAPASSAPAVDCSNLSLSNGMITAVTTLFKASLQQAFPQVGADAVDKIQVTRCANASHGDLQCNSAMALFKLLKQAKVDVKKPQDVAKALVDNVPSNPLVGGMSIAGAGFINVKLAPEVVLSTLVGIARSGPSPPALAADKGRVLVDFSSPNIAKEMHVGHLRSTIIGDSICRVLEFCGSEVMRVNHVGDWGTQFGMLIQYMKESYPDWKTSPPNLAELNTFYKAAKNRFDESEDFKAAARLNVPALQKGDPECRAIWNMLCEISRGEFKKVYDRLDVTLDECGESFYNDRIPAVIEELQKNGQVTMQDKATCMFRDNWQIPLFLKKSDGGFGYDSTDMTALSYRLRELKQDWVIYITDAGQRNHFFMCFDAARDAQWVGDKRLDHIGFGVVCGPDGKRFKSRSGETVRLVDLLDASVTRMKASLQERKKEGKTDLSDADIDAAASKIGYGAVKYFDLKNNPNTNYVFSYDRMLDTRGDTAVYLMFAFARVASIIRKGQEKKGVDMEKLKAEGKLTLDHPAERALAFELMQFPDVLNVTVNTLQPNRLCEYLYALSTKFTEFVTKCHVLGEPEQDSRLLLCQATKETMARVFHLLGITPLQRI